MEAAPAFCIAMHLVALAAMAFLLRGGTLVEPAVELRARYIAEHAAGWTLGWGSWMLAGLGIVWFYAWWAAQLVSPSVLPRPPGRRSAVAEEGRGEGASPMWLPYLGVLLAAVGLLCDWAGEAISAIALVESAVSPAAGYESFLKEERTATLLTAVGANFLYSLGGMLLMFATPDLPKWIRAAMWATWIAGLAMSVSAVVGFVPGMVVSTVVLFPLLVVWVAWMGLHWSRSGSV
jgi:hypothetical protein